MHIHVCQRCAGSIEIVAAGDHCRDCMATRHRERDTCLAVLRADEDARKKFAADTARKVDAFVLAWRGSKGGSS